jgi:membrane protease YdiL (CAAX protease family)
MRERAVLLLVVVATAALSLVLATQQSFNVWLTTGSVAAAGLLLALWLGGARIRDLLHPTSRSVLLGLVVGGASVAVTSLGYRIGVDLFPSLEPSVSGLYASLEDWPGPVLAAPVLLLIVAFEECVWRGLLIDVLQHSRTRGATLVVSIAALAYAVPQLLGAPLLLWAVALGCGLIWGALRVASGGLVAPLLAHALWGACIFIVTPLV